MNCLHKLHVSWAVNKSIIDSPTSSLGQGCVYSSWWYHPWTGPGFSNNHAHQPWSGCQRWGNSGAASPRTGWTVDWPSIYCSNVETSTLLLACWSKMFCGWICHHQTITSIFQTWDWVYGRDVFVYNTMKLRTSFKDIQSFALPKQIYYKKVRG